MVFARGFALAAVLALPACSGPILVEASATMTTSTMTPPPPPLPPPCAADVTSDPANCGVCGHDCLGGACAAGVCQPVELATQDGQPWEIALDADHVYWNNTHGEITRVPKQGGAAQILTDEVFDVGALAVRSGRVYSATYGGPVRFVSTAGGPLQSLTATGSGGIGLAVDDGGVYWAVAVSWPNQQAIMRTDPGGALTSVIGETGHSLTSIAVDASHVYWADYTNEGTEMGGVRRAPLAGGPTDVLVSGHGILPLAIDGERVYWIFSGSSEKSWADGVLYSMPKGGGEPTVIATGLDGATRLAVDDGHVYWTEAYGMLVRKAPKGGGAAVTLAASNGNPQGIAVDGEAVYWVDPGNGRIMKVAK